LPGVFAGDFGLATVVLVLVLAIVVVEVVGVVVVVVSLLQGVVEHGLATHFSSTLTCSIATAQSCLHSESNIK